MYIAVLLIQPVASTRHGVYHVDLCKVYRQDISTASWDILYSVLLVFPLLYSYSTYHCCDILYSLLLTFLSSNYSTHCCSDHDQKNQEA